MSRTKRVIKPNVLATFDNPVVQVKVDPEKDIIQLSELLRQVLVRFQFILGTTFDFQYLSLDGSQVLALRRYIVTRVTQDRVTSEVNHYQTLTKDVTHRVCMPVSELMIFDDSAEVLRDLESLDTTSGVDIARMSINDLQEIMKTRTGKGFPIGTKRDEMVEQVRKHL